MKGNDLTSQRTPSFDPANKITLSWHNINVSVKQGKQRFWNFRKQSDIPRQKQLLINVSGQVRPGELLAIMGPSGAGKTTLLNVLIQRDLRKLIVNGKVLVNGQIMDASAARFSSYVPQNHLFFGTLTVREHLIIQALLRMDKHFSYEERIKRVEEIIVEIGLSKCANTMIGCPGKIKGISGGEMKRLSFASEVLTNPALMICDEPTSGLDSFMSQTVVSVLRDMAAGGRTVICTIHQPSSDVYEMFDHLMLIAAGRVVYMGRADKAMRFFERSGLRCPVNYNPADFFIRNMSIIPRREAESMEKIKSLNVRFQRESSQLRQITTNEYSMENICTQFGQTSNQPKMNGHTVYTISEKYTQFERGSSQRKKFSSPEYSIANDQMNGKSRYKASWWGQFKVILKRSWMCLIRDPTYTRRRFIQNFVMYVTVGIMYLNQKLDQIGITNINAAIFICLALTTYHFFIPVVCAFCEDQHIFLREHHNGMYRMDVYFLSKTITEAILQSMVTIVNVSVFYWMVGLNSQYQAFFVFVAILILVANTVASFGYMISCMCTSLNFALQICSPLIMPIMIFSGFFIKIESMSIYFKWMKYLSWFYYGYEALIINQWTSIKNITCMADESCLSNGTDVLKTLNFDQEMLATNIGMIVVLLVFYRILAFFGLLLKSNRKT